MSSSEDLALLSDTLRKLEPWIGPTDPEEIAEKEHVRERQYERLRNLDADCTPCMHGIIFGHWGKPLTEGIGATTHCKRCHRSWRGIREAHCTVCCEQFASNEAASFHWDESKKGGPSVHRKVEECMREGDKGPRYTALETPFGVTWQLSRYLETS